MKDINDTYTAKGLVLGVALSKIFLEAIVTVVNKVEILTAKPSSLVSFPRGKIEVGMYTKKVFWLRDRR
jgi:hypothetical protein